MPTKKKRCGSGENFKQQIKIMLENAGYDVDAEVPVGLRVGKKSQHIIDLVAGNDSKAILVSCKYQHSPGTADDKIPYELICLTKAMQENNFEFAYLVVKGIRLENHEMLFGEGYAELKKYSNIDGRIRVVTDTQFMAEIVSLDLPDRKQMSLEESFNYV